jgi:hypothetical protein
MRSVSRSSSRARADGARRAHAVKPDRDTSSTRHIVLIVVCFLDAR